MDVPERRMVAHVGFTGTRVGMTPAQRAALIEALRCMGATTFHHGDCVGADAEAHAAIRIYLPHICIHIHPPVAESLRAGCQGDVAHPPLPYLVRNRQIVAASQLLIAAPRATPSQRGGTWYTIRYAHEGPTPIPVMILEGGKA